VEIGDQKFPLAPGTHTGSDLGTVLSRQHYQPSYWRLSNREGNYRRFFDIDGLIGVRVEAPTSSIARTTSSRLSRTIALPDGE